MFISDELAQDLSSKTGITDMLLGMPKLKAQVHTHYQFDKAATEVTFTGPDADKALEEAKKVVDKMLLKMQEDVWKPMFLLPSLSTIGLDFAAAEDQIVKQVIEKAKNLSPGYVFEEYFESDVPIFHPDFRKCPAGDYVVEVISMDYKRSTRENPMVMTEMEIVDGPHRGVTLKAYFVVRESGLVGWDKFLDACGFDDVKPGDDFNIKTCIGSRLRVYVNDEGWIRTYLKETDA